MLLLSRKQLEEVMIGDDIVVTVMEIRGDKVRLGFTAPNGISVHRREVWLAIKSEGSRKSRPAVDNVEND